MDNFSCVIYKLLADEIIFLNFNNLHEDSWQLTIFTGSCVVNSGKFTFTYSYSSNLHFIACPITQSRQIHRLSIFDNSSTIPKCINGKTSVTVDFLISDEVVPYKAIHFIGGWWLPCQLQTC